MLLIVAVDWSEGMLFVSVLAAVLGIIVALFITSDVTISIPDQGGLKLGDPTYDIKHLNAPIVSGWKLRILAYILTQTRFGPSIRRLLLNDNNIHRLRELSAQIGPNHPPLTYPIRRMNSHQPEQQGGDPPDG